MTQYADSQPDGASLPRRRPDIILQAARDDTLLYDPVADAVHVLNATALAVWELCDGRHDAAAIEAALRARFSAAESRDVAADVRAVLARFHEEGLIVGADDG